MGGKQSSDSRDISQSEQAMGDGFIQSIGGKRSPTALKRSKFTETYVHKLARGRTQANSGRRQGRIIDTQRVNEIMNDPKKPYAQKLMEVRGDQVGVFRLNLLRQEALRQKKLSASQNNSRNFSMPKISFVNPVQISLSQDYPGETNIGRDGGDFSSAKDNDSSNYTFENSITHPPAFDSSETSNCIVKEVVSAGRSGHKKSPPATSNDPNEKSPARSNVRKDISPTRANGRKEALPSKPDGEVETLTPKDTSSTLPYRNKPKLESDTKTVNIPKTQSKICQTPVGNQTNDELKCYREKGTISRQRITRHKHFSSEDESICSETSLDIRRDDCKCGKLRQKPATTHSPPVKTSKHRGTCRCKYVSSSSTYNSDYSSRDFKDTSYWYEGGKSRRDRRTCRVCNLKLDGERGCLCSTAVPLEQNLCQNKDNTLANRLRAEWMAKNNKKRELQDVDQPKNVDGTNGVCLYDRVDHIGCTENRTCPGEEISCKEIKCSPSLPSLSDLIESIREETAQKELHSICTCTSNCTSRKSRTGENLLLSSGNKKECEKSKTHKKTDEMNQQTKGFLKYGFKGSDEADKNISKTPMKEVIYGCRKENSKDDCNRPMCKKADNKCNRYKEGEETSKNESNKKITKSAKKDCICRVEEEIVCERRSLNVKKVPGGCKKEKPAADKSGGNAKLSCDCTSDCSNPSFRTARRLVEAKTARWRGNMEQYKEMEQLGMGKIVGGKWFPAAALNETEEDHK